MRKKLNQHNFMIQLFEGLIGDYQQTLIRPARKATDIPSQEVIKPKSPYETNKAS